MLFIAMWLISLTAAAQDSMAVYLQRATAENALVRQRFLEYKSALRKIPQVSALSDPQLELGVFLSPMEIVSGKQVADIKLMQMFPWFGVLKSAKDEMSMMARMKYELLRDAKLQVTLDLQNDAYDLIRVRRQIALTRDNLLLLQSLQRLSVSEFGAGASNATSAKPTGSAPMTGGTKGGMTSMKGNSPAIAPPAPMNETMAGSGMSGGSNTGGLSAVLENQSEADELENSLLTLRDEEKLLQERFNLLLNRPGNLAVTLNDSLSDEPLDIRFLSVSDTTFNRNPMTTMLYYEQKALQARKRMQRQMSGPMVGIGLNYSVIAPKPMAASPMNGRDMLMPMLSLSLPVYRGKYKAQQEETELQHAAVAENIRNTQNELQLACTEARNRYFDADRRMKLYSRQKENVQQMLRIALQSYAAGRKPLSEVQSLRRRQLDYDVKHLQALTDFNKAKAAIWRLYAGND